MPTIVLATGNPHKVQELRAIFAAAAPSLPDFKLIGLTDLNNGPFPEPEEHGTTLAENARIKALSYATQIADPSLFCLADDSGLEIDALGGRPGVISSHYCTNGEERGMSRPERDAANNARVLRELGGPPPSESPPIPLIPIERRTARFVCCMCLARAERQGESWKHAILHETRGVMEGRIGIPPRVPAGDHGFGYDPLFLVAAPPHNFNVTSAELPAEEKNKLSHRGEAARHMAEWLAHQSPRA